MKKKILAMLCLTMALLLLASCGSGKFTSDSAYREMSMNNSGSAPNAEPGGYDGGSYDDAAMYEAEASYAAADSSSYYDDSNGKVMSATGIADIVPVNMSLSEKIIYSSYADIETIHFEESLTALGDMITQFNAFVENSYESGADYASKYYGYNSYRRANYVIRVPSDNYLALKSSLSVLGYVTSKSSDAVNVTEQYTDVESRLAVYRIEESRLLSMLEKCDTVADMITIESTLSGIRYEIESLTSRLKNLDNRVNYSTVTINIREVEELTPTVQIHRTYGQQLSDGLKDTLAGMGRFFKNLFKFAVVKSPVLAILIVIIIVAIVLFRRHAKLPKKQADVEKGTTSDDIENK